MVEAGALASVTHSENGVDVRLVLGLDATKNDVLIRSKASVQVVLVNNSADGLLELELALVLDTSLLDNDTPEPLAVALLMPAHPIDHPPGGKLDRLLNLLAVVHLDKLAEVVDTEGVDQVLEASVGAHLAVTVIALRICVYVHVELCVFAYMRGILGEESVIVMVDCRQMSLLL